MNKFHQQLLEEIKKQSGPQKKYKDPLGYSGTKHLSYSVNVPTKRLIVQKWINEHLNLEVDDFINLLDSLYKGQSIEEKTMAGFLLGYQADLRSKMDLKYLNKWLDELVGWEEIDCTCQSNFKAKEMLVDWEVWEKLLKDFANSKNISKRRASLVLLTGPVGQSDKLRLADLAFNNIDILKSEKDILITKAISWILRSLIKNHKARVEEYLKQNLDSLPKIAIRETKNKLEKGKK